MTLEQISNIIPKLHAGASYIVTYRAKAWLADGVTVIEKIVRKPCRLGVRYSNMQCMVGYSAQPLPGNGKWVIDKYVYEDNNGYKLRISNGAFGKAKSKYYAQGIELDPSICWHSSRKAPAVQCVKRENVISIERKGEKL